MADYRNKTVCVVDNGLFCELATLLAKSFGRTYLYVPAIEKAFPSTNDAYIGRGLEGVELVPHWSTVLDDVDLWVFPDVGQGALQLHLEKLKKRVWGARMGEELELYRADAKRHLKAVGVPIGPYKVVKGLDALAKYLKTKENQFVKGSRRGDFETFKSESFDIVQPQLDDLRYRLGPAGDEYEFVVEEEIPDAVEIGYDGFTVRGQYPARVMTGLEVKDRGYVGRIRPFTEIAEQLQDSLRALVPTFTSYGYAGFVSTEERVVANGDHFMIDPCCRMGSPPGQAMMYNLANIADVLWEGAEGRMREPEWTAEWVAQLMLSSGWVDQHWQPVAFPAGVRDQVKISFPARSKAGEYFSVPQKQEVESAGAIVATGATMDEAIANVSKLADQVRGYRLSAPVEALEDAKEQLEELKAFGVEL